jgi:hypothetical protein
MIALLACACLQADYFPLDPGIAWTYETTAGRRYVKRVVGREKVGGADCAVVQHGETERHWLSAGADGVRVHRSKGVAFDEPLLIFKFPLAAGDAWSGKGGTRDGEIRYAFTTAGEEAVEVPAGAYRAMRVDWTMGQGDQASKGKTWLARGVGPVKESYEAGGRESGLSLVSFARPGETYLPLKKGAKWVYKTDYDDTTEIVHEVTATEKVGEVECFVVEHRTEFNAGQPDARVRMMRKEWLARGQGGILLHRTQRGPSEMKLDAPFFRLKEPLKKGDEWNGDAKVGDTPTKWHQTVEGEEDVEVPAGKFKAWKVRYDIQTGERHRFEGWEWFVKDVGVVKTESHIHSSGETFDFVAELKKFTPGN